MKQRRTLYAAMALLICALALTGCKVNTGTQTTPTAAATASPTVALTPVMPTGTIEAIKGLVLVVPILVDNVEMINQDVLPDGTYRERLMFDGMVTVETERLLGVEFSETAVAQQIAVINGINAADITIKQDDKVTAQLTYPAWRITYATGANEDARTNVDIYIQTDDWNFRFHTSTPADVYDDYTDSIEAWIESLDLFDGT